MPAADEVEAACPRFPEVQHLTNTAVKMTDRGNLTSQQWGTAVHARLRRMIEELGDATLRPEVSLLKTLDESGPSRVARFGETGTIRIDVYEDVGNGVVCVYDIKTGNSGLLPGRSEEIAGTVYRNYAYARRVIAIEIRPFE